MEGVTMEKLAYFVEAPKDGRDMTKEIEEKLTRYGVCLLGSGTYRAAGICMPEGSTISGMGAATRLLLPIDLTEGFVLKMNSYTTVKDLAVIGSEAPIPLPDKVGARHGILFSGTATRKEWMDQPVNAILSGCFISGFTGGGLTCIDTGYYIRSSMAASNCHIINCGAGIYIPHFSEYHEFTNMQCCENLYGCVNNGGNNVFVNCGFNGNETAFLIDNSDGNAWNNSHGSAIGCTFNHSGNNKGIGIRIIGASCGYVFTGCQDFFSKIIVEDSIGVQFSAMNFGRAPEIYVKGGKPVFFSGCVFYEYPHVLSVTDGATVRFSECYTRDGEPVSL